jgi:hypothetical protein
MSRVRARLWLLLPSLVPMLTLVFVVADARRW